MDLGCDTELLVPTQLHPLIFPSLSPKQPLAIEASFTTFDELQTFWVRSDAANVEPGADVKCLEISLQCRRRLTMHSCI